MKLAYLTASFPYGSGESFVSAEIEYHLKNNMKIFLFPLWSRGSLKENKLLKNDNLLLLEGGLITVQIFFSFLIFIYLEPIIFFNILKFILKSKLKHLFKNLLLLPKAIYISRMINMYDVEHLHVHWSSTTATAGLIAAMASKIEWSFTCHRWDIYDNNLLSVKSDSAKFVRFISNKGKLDAISRGVSESKAIVIPMGVEIPVNVSFTKYESKGELFNLICPANLIDVKGHVFLIEAVKKLVEKKYNIRLYIAGEGNLKKKLQQQVKDYDLEEQIVFLGQLSHSNLLNYYREKNIHCVVLPSLDLGNGLHEGIPVSLMEGMAFRKLVISTKTGSIPELLPDYLNVTTEHKNHLKLADLISFYVDNPNIYRNKCIELNGLIINDWNINKSMQVFWDLVLNNN